MTKQPGTFRGPVTSPAWSPFVVRLGRLVLFRDPSPPGTRGFGVCLHVLETRTRWGALIYTADERRVMWWVDDQLVLSLSLSLP